MVRDAHPTWLQDNYYVSKDLTLFTFNADKSIYTDPIGRTIVSFNLRSIFVGSF